MVHTPKRSASADAPGKQPGGQKSCGALYLLVAWLLAIGGLAAMTRTASPQASVQTNSAPQIVSDAPREDEDALSANPIKQPGETGESAFLRSSEDYWL